MGKLVLSQLSKMARLRLQRIWADGGYRGELVTWCHEHGPFTLDIVSPPAGQKGFQVLPRRWVVERSFAWSGH